MSAYVFICLVLLFVCIVLSFCLFVIRHSTCDVLPYAVMQAESASYSMQSTALLQVHKP